MASMSQAIVWIHGDCLNPHQAALLSHPDSSAIWVWDDALLRQRCLSLKRILFIYECLLDLPVVIRRGQVAQEISKFAQENNATKVVTTNSFSPGFARICISLTQQGLQIVRYDLEPFVDLPQAPDLGRFSRYWRLVKPHLE